MSNESFIEKAVQVHADKYDYSLVAIKNNQTPVRIICPIHGEFTQRPSDHIHQASGCNQCGNISIGQKNSRWTTETYVQKAQELHADRYDYSITKFISIRQPLEIICRNHGPFWQSADNHIHKKTGCPYCADELGNSIVRENWIIRQNGRIATLYLAHFTLEGESFYKIGITLLTVAERFKKENYKIEVIHTIQSNNPADIFDLEKTLHTHFKAHTYAPFHSFPGQTECFQFDNIPSVIDSINRLCRLHLVSGVHK